MTKFEQKGIQYLNNATDKEQANRTFAYSCSCCCSKGMHLKCDHCAIAQTHAMIIAYFDEQEGER